MPPSFGLRMVPFGTIYSTNTFTRYDLHMKTAGKPQTHLSVGFTVSTVGYAVSRRFREILAPLKLEPREFALLRAVSASEGESQQVIGGRLKIPPSRMVAFVDALEARGLLERRLNPDDRRTRELHL